MTETTAWNASSVFVSADEAADSVPVYLAEQGQDLQKLGLDAHACTWLNAQKFTGSAKKSILLPKTDGTLGGVVLGAGNNKAGEPSGPSELLLGHLASSVPGGRYRLATTPAESELAAIAWGLGAYRFTRYRGEHKKDEDVPRAKLCVPPGANAARVTNIVEAIWFGRDLINTPASDMGPDELEQAARGLASRHGANISVIKGDDLLTHNFPMIHAVGRAHPRAPRLIDITWGPADGEKITLVGKGITFDTGGLDIKPASAMLIMKKDMGGAATALALGHMIMGQKLNCRLRILLPVAENSIAGDAFRPGDILTSRAGLSVEIGNTDAEGRLVLADALALADEESPKSLFVFATLTGAARTALGPDLPAFFTDDNNLAVALTALSEHIGDPVWRLPLWEGYRRHLDSDVADMNNVWDTPFAGAITAALFLRRFVKNAGRFAHFDLYGWRTAPRPLGPKGGEPQTARAVMEVLRAELQA